MELESEKSCVQQRVQPDSAIVTLFAEILRAKNAPIYASQVNPMLGGRFAQYFDLILLKENLLWMNLNK